MTVHWAPLVSEDMSDYTDEIVDIALHPLKPAIAS